VLTMMKGGGSDDSRHNLSETRLPGVERPESFGESDLGELYQNHPKKEPLPEPSRTI